MVKQVGSVDIEKLLEQITSGENQGVSQKGDDGFWEMLKGGISEVNQAAVKADKSSVELATGKTDNIHGVMLDLTKAQLGLEFMVQMRNKVIEAYQEVMRMQV